MNSYETLGVRPGGEPAYTEAAPVYGQLLAEHLKDATHREYGYPQETPRPELDPRRADVSKEMLDRIKAKLAATDNDLGDDHG